MTAKKLTIDLAIKQQFRRIHGWTGRWFQIHAITRKIFKNEEAIFNHNFSYGFRLERISKAIMTSNHETKNVEI